MGNPKLSVIVPVYNVEEHLKRCLDSLRCQNYPNLEFVLVDDGSTDGSGRICDEYAAVDARFQVIHQENAGAASARNAGLDAATGGWIGFVDSDDYIEPDMYSYLLELAQRHNADIVQCGLLWEEGDQHEICNTAEQEMCIALDEPIPTELWKYFANSSSNKLFSRERIDSKKFNSAFIIGEDFLFNLQILSDSHKVALGTKAAYHYVQNTNSVCHAAVNSVTLESMRNMLLYAEKLFASRESLVRFCRDQRMNNNFDICSKLVCAEMASQYTELVDTIRQEMRMLWHTGYETRALSSKEKIKCFLIGYAWGIYQFGLPRWKKWGLSNQKVR